MRNKFFIQSLFIVMSLFLIVGCSSNSNDKGSSSEGGDETITLKLATASPETSLFSTSTVEPFMERVTELTDGQVQFDFYPAGQLGAAHDLLSLTKDGVADIAYMAPTYFSSEMPLSAYVVGVPGLFETSHDGTVAYNALLKNEEAPFLETDFLNNGVRPLYGLMLPTYDLYTKGKEIKLPEDFKGMKTRATGGISADAIEYLGGTPVSMDTADMYSAFDKGVLDAIHNYPSSILTFGVAELIGYGTTGLGFSSVAVGLMINEDLWQELPENVKEAMEQASEEAALNGAKEHDAQQKEIEKQFIDDGVTIHEVTEEEKAEWDKAFDEFAEYYMENKADEEFKIALDMLKEEIAKVKE